MRLKTLLGSVYFGVFFLLIVFSALATLFVFTQPENFRLLTVQSGSMSPAIKQGSVIAVVSKKPKALSPLGPLPEFTSGEIITFSSGKEMFTHRIVSVGESNGEIFYQTKGDANSGVDMGQVSEGKVLGKVVFSLPYLGSFISSAKTQTGYIFLIIIPATIVIYHEVINIKEELKKMLARKKLTEVA